jgi:hypothetical protein
MPPEQRALPQRAPIGPPPPWLPSIHAVSIGLVVALVLFAAIFQSILAPGIGVDGAANNGTSVIGTHTPGADEASFAGTAVASPAALATPELASNVGADTEPLLPNYRIVSYYGHPNDESMGILGQFSKDDLLEQLLDEARAYERADPSRPVMPAFEIVYSVAQSEPGPDGTYLLQTDDATMQEYISFTQANDILLFIDIQFGKSTIQDELAHVEKYLMEPNVHLAIDPEFAWGPNHTPGVDFGSVNAQDITYAQQQLARIVAENNLPPKVLVVHRFTDGMVKNITQVKPVDNVQFVLDFDGFGDPGSKTQGYNLYVRDSDVPFGGIKLFYDQDKPLMKPDEVVDLDPAPDFVMYQ